MQRGLNPDRTTPWPGANPSVRTGLTTGGLLSRQLFSICNGGLHLLVRRPIIRCMVCRYAASRHSGSVRAILDGGECGMPAGGKLRTPY